MDAALHRIVPLGVLFSSQVLHMEDCCEPHLTPYDATRCFFFSSEARPVEDCYASYPTPYDATPSYLCCLKHIAWRIAVDATRDRMMPRMF